MLLVRTSCARMQRKDPFSADVAIWSCCGAAWHWCDRARWNPLCRICLPNLSAERRYGEGSSCLKRVAGLCGRFSTPYVACRKLGARMARCGPQAIFELGCPVACKMCPSGGICAGFRISPQRAEPGDYGSQGAQRERVCAVVTGMRR